jgi:hypothetical protein
MENSGFIGNDELTGYINDSLSELYDLLITKYGEDYYTKPVPHEFPINGQQEFYSLPSDFYKLRGVDLNLGAKESISLKPFMFTERNRYYNNNVYAFDRDGISRARYRIIGRKIWFIPSPTGNKTIQIWYIPLAPVLEDADDEFDAVNGWEEYIVIDTAIKMLAKEESDVTVLASQLVKITERINRAAHSRDAGRSQRVSDVSRDGTDFSDGIT